VDLYGDFLYRFALARVRDPSVAEDMVQETFVAALRGRDRFQGRSSQRTWLAAILKHKIVDHIRRQIREQASDQLETVGDGIDPDFDGRGRWRHRPKRWAANPMKLYEQKEFFDAFYRCLADLPERLSRIFMLREVDGLSTEEICKALEVTATNSWVMLYRARMGLRRCLEQTWFEGAGAGSDHGALDV